MIKLNYSLKTTMVLLLICLASLLNAQTIFVDLTTGPGTCSNAPDPNWDVENTSGSNNFQDAFVVNPIYNFYDEDDCGNWISPARSSGCTTDDANQGPYIYKYEFDVDLQDCEVISAILDLPFIAADNELRSITLNGSNNTISVPNPYIEVSPAGSISNQSVANFIQDGINVLEVTVHNRGKSPTGSPTPNGLMLCGGITIVKECRPCYLEKPTNLSCSSNVLNWDDVPDFTGFYQLEINWNDPNCCSGAVNPPFSTLVDVVVGSEYTVSSILEDCFSWRVRAYCDQCDEESVGPWSDYSCSCPMGPIE